MGFIFPFFIKIGKYSRTPIVLRTLIIFNCKTIDKYFLGIIAGVSEVMLTRIGFSN